MDFGNTSIGNKPQQDIWSSSFSPHASDTVASPVVPRRQRSSKQKQPRKDDKSFSSARFRQKERSKPAEEAGIG